MFDLKKILEFKIKKILMGEMNKLVIQWNNCSVNITKDINK